MGLDVRGLLFNPSGVLLNRDFIKEIRPHELRVALTPFNVEDNGFGQVFICCEDELDNAVGMEIRRQMKEEIEGTDWWTAVTVGGLQEFIHREGMDPSDEGVKEILSEDPGNWVVFVGDIWVLE